MGIQLVSMISTTPTAPWQAQPVAGKATAAQADLVFTNERGPVWEGFGGCFNELGWVALSALDENTRAQVIRDLFDPHDGCRFTFCRLPIGASDYAASWYSLNETDGDFAMEQFSIAHDRHYLIPYIKMAQALQPRLKLFASPWSPPTWMKFPKAYNYGAFIMQPDYLEAYARYFLKFVQAYRTEGMTINQVHVQNEPLADQKFPSCVWTGEQLRELIRDYVGPLFREQQPDCEVWLGTLNTDDYNGYPNTLLSDPKAREYTGGVGLQWAGKGMVERLHQAWPTVRLMQTENECGEGKNSWEYAGYIFDLMRHYITNGVSAYVYWNMVLQPGGLSTWGWNQNAMVTVDPATKAVTYNPEFYVMKHYSRFVAEGATFRGLTGAWAGNATAFENPDGSTVIIVANPFTTDRQLTLDGTATVSIPGNSFNTLVFQS